MKCPLFQNGDIGKELFPTLPWHRSEWGSMLFLMACDGFDEHCGLTRFENQWKYSRREAHGIDFPKIPGKDQE